MIPNRIEQTQEELMMQFVANCVQWAADAVGVDYLTMFRRLDNVGMIDKYLMEFYDVLHFIYRRGVYGRDKREVSYTCFGSLARAIS